MVREHRWQVLNRHRLLAEGRGTFENATPAKPWNYSPAFGGGSNCWWATTPRFFPEDFRLASTHGAGVDWPLGYDDLEEAYCDAEEAMQISGPPDAPWPRSRPYPQPPHRPSAPDERLRVAFPGEFFVQPTARAAVATANRNACCATGVCEVCPHNAKFTIPAELGGVYRDPRVTLALGAAAVAVETAGDRATGVRYLQAGKDSRARGDLVALAANALFNPALLLASGLRDGDPGAGLCEQVGVTVRLHLRGLENFQGSTSSTGHGTMFYPGPHRRERAACLVETMNVPVLREERGRWRELLDLRFVFEDDPAPANRVELAVPGRPRVRYAGPAARARRGLAVLPELVDRLAAALPVEEVMIGEPDPTESHILCTTPMGSDPAASVVDADLRHHRLRNLLVLGGSTFPTCPPANPTLTLAALSLRAARRLHG